MPEGKDIDAGSGRQRSQSSCKNAEHRGARHRPARPFGETGTPSTRAGFDKLIGADWRETTLAMMLEKSYVGMRVDDIAQSASRWLRRPFQQP